MHGLDDSLFNVIFSYTRKQAIEDGNLIDITEQAKETGFKVPVAVPPNLYERYITPPKGFEGEGQSTTGRLQDPFCYGDAMDLFDGSAKRLVFFFPYFIN
ncbi:DUF6573 family protein [Maridesulfovibrio zosterae]|uniref:DUF6573 family protein n=1 Tax=Maridesulfovibrio zosterae TaxID=82171 RepID=UPI00041B59AE